MNITMRDSMNMCTYGMNFTFVSRLLASVTRTCTNNGKVAPVLKMYSGATGLRGTLPPL
jgi:hypothetical protein